MNHQIYEEASDWLVEFRTESVDAGVRRRFQDWLESSPMHVQAYLELARIWEVVSAGNPNETDVDALIARAGSGANVVPLPPAQGAARPSVRGRRTTHALRFAVAAVLACIAIAMAWTYLQRNTYSTAVGERRSILLSDGSTIDLNASSTVRIGFTSQRRDIELLEGQALFQVARDKARPFVVTSNRVTVRALGTQFDVNQRARSTIVTVVEGTVAISPGAPPGGLVSKIGDKPGSAPAQAGQLTLAAGEQAVLVPGRMLRSQRADIVTATAWTKRRLVFDSTPLKEVAEEFNRNNARRLVIADEGLDAFHVSGAFSSSDPQPLLAFLKAQPGVEVVDEGDRIVVSRAR